MADDAEHCAETDEPGLDDILCELVRIGHQEDRVSVHDVQDLLGPRGFGPFMFVPAIIEISPIGGIPGLPTLLALMIVTAAVQLLFGRHHFWLPHFLGRRATRGDRLEKAVQKVRPIARFIDRWVRPRAHRFTREPFIRIAALICIGMAATVPMLEIIPFASTIPMAVIALLGLGLMVGDGILVLVASCLSLAAFYAAYALVF